MAEKRVYLVIDQDGAERLVKAISPAQALRHVSQSKFSVKAATASESVDFLVSGGKLEEVGEEPEVAESTPEEAPAST
jgi:hypothetical protein